MNEVLDAALDLHGHGYAVIRAAVDGTKRPYGPWREYQVERPREEQVRAWFANGHTGVGIVPGHVSGDAEMLEFEGRAVAEGLLDQWSRLMDAAGLAELRERLRGWVERTPTGGYHLHYRLDGATPAGNTKLASRLATADELAVKPDQKTYTLVETRGEGGFVVVAPSNGKVHPTGEAWQRIGGGPATTPLLTVEERDALWDVCRLLDQTPEPAPPPPPASSAAAAGGLRPGDDYARRTDWGELLTPRGWVHVYTHSTVRYWRRPGKAKGISATTGRNDGDNLFVFSTSTEFDAQKPYSKFAAYAVLEHGGDDATALKAAAKELARLGYGEQRQQPRTRPRTGENPANGDEPADTENRALLLPADFWEDRPVLGHIRTAAWSRGRCPDAVLHACLARVAAMAPHEVTLNTGVGTPAVVCYLTALVDDPGGGKSDAEETGCDLITPPPWLTGNAFRDGVPLGSGEGLAELFMGEVEEKDPDNQRKKKKIRKQVRYNAYLYVDEGEAYNRMSQRSGATIGSALRIAWKGTTLGQHNATEERTRVIPRHSYAIGVVMAFQPATIAPLLAEAEINAGTPQRFTYCWATDPGRPRGGDRPTWPGAIAWTPPQSVPPGGYGIADTVKAEIQTADDERGRPGAEPIHRLDVHRNLETAKLALLLALLDERTTVTPDDWRLAQMMWATSCNVRNYVLGRIQAEQKQAEEAITRKIVRRQKAVEDGLDERAMAAAKRQAVARVARHHDQHPEPGCPLGCLRVAVAHKYRQVVRIEAVAERAVAEELLTRLPSGRYEPGKR